MENRIKCSICKRVKFEIDFVKHNKILKSCITCREKNNEKNNEKNKEKPVKKGIVPEVKPQIVQDIFAVQDIVSVQDTGSVQDIIAETNTESKPLPSIKTDSGVVPKRWIRCSGKWIQEGDERKRHEELTKRWIQQFKRHSAFSVHKYLTTWLRVDIRDRYCPSNESTIE